QSIRREPVAMHDFVRQNGHQVLRSGGVEVLPGAGGGVINVYPIKQDIWGGCNKVSIVSPVYGLTNMREVDTGKPPMSWNEYQALLAQGKVEKIQPPEHV